LLIQSIHHRLAALFAFNSILYFLLPLQPPENELQKARDSNVALSEHQLRVQASLQKLNIPDWYKQYSGTSSHNTSVNTSYYNKSDVTGLLRKRNSDIGRWQGLNSKTTSLSSLGKSSDVESVGAQSHWRSVDWILKVSRRTSVQAIRRNN